ncbi:MAG: LysR family transcriptional regulator [Labrys sp. (in: a-proteobacteria)]|jgi:DNA-binding transcriptional LysR family regulator
MSRPISWDLIASMRAVLETGSLSAAARSRGVTQPTIRRHVDEIEAALGVALFTRSPNGLIPTSAARDIAPYAQDIDALVAALVRTASAERDSIAGTVRLSCSEVMAAEVLPALLAPFLDTHADLAIELVASNRVENLLRRDADLAVRMVRPTQDGLVARKVATVALGFHAAVAYLERYGEPSDLASLIRDHRLIGEDRGTSIAEAIAHLAPEAGPITFRYRTDSDTAQLGAVRAGIGIGVCQVPIAAADPRLRAVLPGIRSSLDVWLVTHADLRQQRRVRAVMDHLAEALASFAA